MTIITRKAQPEDVDCLARIFLLSRRQAFHWENSSRFQLEDFQKQTQDEAIFVADDMQGNLVGFVSVYVTNSFIHHLFVLPEYQRCGVGTLLLQSLYSWLPFPYTLKCVIKNQSALMFYRKNGWIEVSRGIGEDGEYIYGTILGLT